MTLHNLGEFTLNRNGVRFCHQEESVRKSEDNTSVARTPRESALYDYVDDSCINQKVQPPPYIDIINENTDVELHSEEHVGDDIHRYESLQNYM